MFWGISEDIDLLDEYKRHVQSNSVRDELNILLYGASDPRHILRILASVRLAAAGEPAADTLPRKINIYLLEGCLEVVARSLLLVNLALEPPEELSLKARTHMFMDLYGNSLLRPASHQYLCSKGRLYTDCITDLEGRAAKVLPLFDFASLKYGERDTLAGIFTFWQNRPHFRFDMADYWEQRVRKDLGSRYDHRHGAFDWDLQMRLRDNGVKRVCVQEYKHWRDTGVAFTYPEYEQTVPNKTLAAGVFAHGSRFGHRGYVGDILTGPFVTYGEHCPDAALLRSTHGTNQYRATDIAERNLLGLMYELRDGRKYQHEVGHTRDFGGSVLVLGKHMSAEAAAEDTIDQHMRQFDKPAITCVGDRVRVSVLSADDVLNIARRERFAGAFDVVFVGQNYYPFLGPDFRKILRRNGVGDGAGSGSLVVFETKQNLVLRKAEVGEFLSKVGLFARCQRLRAVTKFNLNIPMPLVRFVADLQNGGEGEEQVDEEFDNGELGDFGKDLRCADVVNAALDDVEISCVGDDLDTQVIESKVSAIEIVEHNEEMKMRVGENLVKSKIDNSIEILTNEC